MVDPTSVFEAPSESLDSQDPTEQQATQPTSENQDTGLSIPPEVVDMIGPGKKYADVTTALRSIAHAQRHIGTLQAELRALREQAKPRDLEDTLAEINTVTGGSADHAAADPDTVAERVIAKLDKRTQAQKAKDNILAVNDALTKTFGTLKGATEAVAAKAAELGMSVEDMKSLAAKNPRAVLAYFSGVSVENAPAPVGSVNSASAVRDASAGAIKPNTYKWYQAERKKRGDAWYFSQGVTQQRTSEAVKQGKAFYN